MKQSTILLFALLLSFNGHSQKAGDIYFLKGFIIVACFDEHIKSGCDLNIKTIKAVSGDSMTCGDGNFYKNVSYIKYINRKNIDLKFIDNFNYQIKIQKDEHHLYLSSNPAIIKDVHINDSTAIIETDLSNSIKQNAITADLIQTEIEKLHPDFKRKNYYDIVMEVSIKVIELPARKKPITYGDPLGLNQYIILYDKLNSIKGIKVIKGL